MILLGKTMDSFEILSKTSSRPILTMQSPDPFKKCEFPFIYNKIVYTSCVSDSSSDSRYAPWCATEVKENLEVVDGKWGICSYNCWDSPNSPGNLKPFSFEDNTNTELPPSPRHNYARGGRHQSRHPYYTRYYGHHYG